MANLSKFKRDKLISFLNKLKEKNNDDESIMLLNEIELSLTEKKYGLVWEKHTEEVDELLKNNIPIFKEVEKRKIKVDDKKYNFLLEGDNLHSLKLLQKTHKGRIDVIYIDPPYNTGNNDFIYDDKLIDKNDGYSHSKWLSFMNERLSIARELLSKQGVIFISIDDNEQAQLKLLCDEIFGEENFIANYKWNKTSTPPSLSKKVRRKYEYILCYEKETDGIEYNGGETEGGDMPLLNTGNGITKIKFPKESVVFNFDGIYKKGKKNKKIEDFLSTFYFALGNSKKNQIKDMLKDGKIERTNSIENEKLFSVIHTKKYAYALTEKGIPEYSEKITEKYLDEIKKKEDTLKNKFKNINSKGLENEYASISVKFNTLPNILRRFVSQDRNYNFKFAVGNSYIKTTIEKRGNDYYMVSYLLDSYSNPKDLFNKGIKNSEFGSGVPYMIKLKLRETKYVPKKNKEKYRRFKK